VRVQALTASAVAPAWCARRAARPAHRRRQQGRGAAQRRPDLPGHADAIRAAKRRITFETYIYWSETIGKEFADALAERARAGVKVHLLLDYIGSIKIDDDSMKAMRRGRRAAAPLPQAGLVEAGAPEQPHPPQAAGRRRPVGFTGGVGIADKWRGNGQDADHWRDTHFRVEGPVVGQMQAVFNDNWTKATGVVLDGERLFPGAGAVPATCRPRCSPARPRAAAKACT
jgi:cardiolipin synthase